MSRSSCSRQIGQAMVAGVPTLRAGANQLRMGVAHLVLAQAPTVVLVDQVPARQPMIDHPTGAAQGTCAERLGTERHDPQGYRCAVHPPSARHDTRHTVRMSIWYGAHVADESELRLCGDLAGKRVIELGVAGSAGAITPNSVTAAMAGAKAMALDPDPQAIAAVRAAAEQAEVTVQCHQGDLADLGFATSASVDLVVASHTLGRRRRPAAPAAPGAPRAEAGRPVRRCHAPPGRRHVRRPGPHGHRRATAPTASPSPSCTWRSSAATSASTWCTSSTTNASATPLCPVGARAARPQTGRLTPRQQLGRRHDLATPASTRLPPALPDAGARTGSPGRDRSRSRAAG